MDIEIMQNYNYEEFIPENFEPLMRFDESPSLGAPAPNFSLWNLEDRKETSLKELWSNHLYLVVEFRSFT